MSRQPIQRIDPEDLLAHLDWLAALARQLVREPGLAEDLTQDTCVVALQHGPDDPGRIRLWLATIARNLLRQRVRGEGRRRAREESEARPTSVEPTDVLVERVSMQRHLAQLVLELEEPCRTSVLLRFYANLAPQEIARQLGVPVTTVQGRIQRGLRSLRTRLDDSAGPTPAWSALLLGPISNGSGPLLTHLGGFLVTAKLVLSAALVVAGSWIAVLAWRQSDGPARPSTDHSVGVVQSSEEGASDSGSALASARVIVPAAPAESPAGPAVEAVPEPTALERSRETLTAAIEATLRGDVDASAFLDLGLAMVELEVDPRAIPEASPGGAVRFPLKGMPDGMKAELHVRATSRGQPALDLHVELDAPSSPYILEGAARQAPRLDLSARSDEQGEPTHFIVLAGSGLSGPGNRDAGIALDQGRFPLSVNAAFPMDDLMRPSVKMGSLVDGKLLGNESIDTWRIVGGTWPREADIRLFHQKLFAMHASLGK